MYFLGINPEDDLPHPSLLAKFRKHKLEGNLTIDEIIVEINKQGVEKGILRASGISIDTTHSEANTFKCTAERACPLRDQCIKGTTVGRILEVGINTPEFYGYSQEQKTDEFKEKYKKRTCQEWKNREMKNFHGLDRARGYGLKSMALQAKLTALAVNLKRIAKILSSNKSVSRRFIVIYFKIPNKNLHFLEAA